MILMILIHFMKMSFALFMIEFYKIEFQRKSKKGSYRIFLQIHSRHGWWLISSGLKMYIFSALPNLSDLKMKLS